MACTSVGVNAMYDNQTTQERMNELMTPCVTIGRRALKPLIGIEAHISAKQNAKIPIIIAPRITMDSTV